MGEEGGIIDWEGEKGKLFFGTDWVCSLWDTH